MLFFYKNNILYRKKKNPDLGKKLRFPTGLSGGKLSRSARTFLKLTSGFILDLKYKVNTQISMTFLCTSKVCMKTDFKNIIVYSSQQMKLV